jgi:predicted 3-demethylubiquinone-9 3-methyltransferase (glyoxalase superfamily)
MAQRITPFLWFNGQAEEAASFYISVFKNSKVLHTARYGEAGPGRKGTVMTIQFQLDGQEFIALNAGTPYQFNEAISLTVDCKNQQEIDHYWEKLSAGGEQRPCGWLKDKFGVSWQVNPTILGEMHRDADPDKAARTMKAMLQMKKIVIADLERAYAGETAPTPKPT